MDTRFSTQLVVEVGMTVVLGALVQIRHAQYLRARYDLAMSSFAHAFRVLQSEWRARGRRRRSPAWRALEHWWLAHQPVCQACGGTARLQVHHIEPVAKAPELECDPKNLITLCMGARACHFRIGHGGSWRAYNPEVVYDAYSCRVAATDWMRTFIAERARAWRKPIA
jgi:hypothetical protein